MSVRDVSVRDKSGYPPDQVKCSRLLDHQQPLCKGGGLDRLVRLPVVDEQPNMFTMNS